MAHYLDFLTGGPYSDDKFENIETPEIYSCTGCDEIIPEGCEYWHNSKPVCYECLIELEGRKINFNPYK